MAKREPVKVDTMEVLRYLAKHSPYVTSQLLKLPRTVVQRISEGVLVKEYTPKPKGIAKSARGAKGRCSCCGKNKIKDGNRFLCQYCFKNYSDMDAWALRPGRSGYASCG
jgi:hypothetical protein